MHCSTTLDEAMEDRKQEERPSEKRKGRNGEGGLNKLLHTVGTSGDKGLLYRIKRGGKVERGRRRRGGRRHERKTV